MFCDHSEKCIYYRTYKYKSSSKQFQLLAESYCEGELRSRCQLLQYKSVYSEEPPENLAPNGYLIGTHKKLKIENNRKHKRYKIDNGTCLLQVLDSDQTFTGWIVDVSEGGLRVELDSSAGDIVLCPKKSHLKILGYSLEEAPISITKELVKVVWQKKRAIGCCFENASSAA